MQLSSEDEWPALCGAGGAVGGVVCGGEAEMVEWLMRWRMFEGRLRWVREGRECARGRVVLAAGLLLFTLVQFWRAGNVREDALSWPQASYSVSSGKRHLV